MKQKKLVYEEPIISVIMLEAEDIITLSGGEEGNIDQNKGTYDDIFKNPNW